MGCVPTLKTFEDLYVKYRKYLRKSVGDGEHSGLVMYSYLVASKELFREECGREARGIVFDESSGELVSRPIEKFFNYGEPLAPNEGEVLLLGDKFDGSMLQVSATETGRVFIGSRSTAAANEQAYVYQTFYKLPESVRNKVISAAKKNPEYTFIFELLDPNHQIVVKYNELSIVFLVARHKYTGEYLFDFAGLEEFTPTYYLPTDDMTTLEDILHKAKQVEGIEGWVVYLTTKDDGRNDFIKIKTPWYTERHALFSKLSLPQHYLFAWAEDTLDDLIGYAKIIGHTEKYVTAEKVKEELDKAINKFLKKEKLDGAFTLTQRVENRKELALELQKWLDMSDPFEKIIFSGIMSNYENRKDTATVYSAIVEGVKKSTLKSNSKVKDVILSVVEDVLGSSGGDISVE